MAERKFGVEDFNAIRARLRELRPDMVPSAKPDASPPEPILDDLDCYWEGC